MGKGQQMVEWIFKRLKIDWITNAAIKNVTATEINLTDGRKILYKFAIIIPPFKGVQAIRNSQGIGDERGFVTVNSRYQHLIYKNIYAAGVAVAILLLPIQRLAAILVNSIMLLFILFDSSVYTILRWRK